MKRHAVKATRETAEGRYRGEYRSTTLAEQVNGVTSVSYGGAGAARAREGRWRHGERGEGDAVCVEWARKLRTFARFKGHSVAGVLRDDGRALAVGGQAEWWLLTGVEGGAAKVYAAPGVRAVRWSADKLSPGVGER